MLPFTSYCPDGYDNHGDHEDSNDDHHFDDDYDHDDPDDHEVQIIRHSCER